MIHTRRLAWLVAVVLGMCGASGARAVPAPDPSSPLALIPADVAVVVQLHGVQRTTARIQALLKNAAPEDQKFLALALDGLIQQALDGRQIKGLAPDGPVFLVLLSVPRPGETPQFALVGRVTSYADFRDSFLREQEKKSIKADPAGYELATLDNETAYFLDRKGFVIITPSREAAERFLKPRAGLDSKLDKEDAQALLAADLSAYADVAEIYKAYRDQIEQLKDGLQQAIQLAQGANNADQRTMELGWLVLRSLFQVMADEKSAVATVDFRPEGLALGLQLQVGAATATAELLQEARPAPLKDLGLLPAGQLAYYAMQLDPGTAKVLVPLVQGTPALESDKKLRAALEEITAAGPRFWVGTYHIPYEAAQVVDYQQPAKAMQAQIQLYQALAAGDQVQSLPLKNKPELRPQTLEHRGFKLQQVTFHWDFDSLANQPGGMETIELMKKLMGERTDIWFGTNGKAFVQIVARDWDSARKKLDQLFDNQNTVGQTRAFQEARRQLPDQASLISLLDLPQYVQMTAEVLQPLLKAANAPIDLSGVKADRSKTSYLGTALTLQPERGRADLWLPAAGVAEVRRMLEPVLQKLLNPCATPRGRRNFPPAERYNGAMPGNTFGDLFRVTTAGVSHGPGYLCIIDGCPPGLPLSEDDLLPDLRRRRPGQSSIVSQRKEEDRPEIWSGVFEGQTDGTPIGILFRNQDPRSQDYSDIKDKYRPGHADFTFDAKYGFRDYRGGGRSSARETMCRVAAAAVAKKLLAREGIRIVGYVKQVGPIVADIPDPAQVTLEQVEANPVRCPDPAAAAQMLALIEEVRKDQDSIGGVSELVASGVPPGLGEPVFDKLKADLAKGLLSLPAVMGFEYGAGFGVATARGSQNNDAFIPKPPRIGTETNRHGGMLGGISSGEPIVCRVALKPTSSLPRPQRTVTRSGQPTEIATRGRHDPCLLPRFVPMGEAMVALVLVDHWLRWKAQCRS